MWELRAKIKINSKKKRNYVTSKDHKIKNKTEKNYNKSTKKKFKDRNKRWQICLIECTHLISVLTLIIVFKMSGKVCHRFFESNFITVFTPFSYFWERKKYWN